MGGKRPRGAAATSRRYFFRRFLAETISLFEEIQGKPQLNLGDIADLPDEIVRKIIPVFSQHSRYRIENDQLFVATEERNHFKVRHQFNSMELYVLNQFDGHNTLDLIIRRVAGKFDVEDEAAFQQVKIFFCAMTGYAVCHPMHETPRP